MSQPYRPMFSSGRSGRLTSNNRLLPLPIVRNYAEEQGCATPRCQFASLRTAQPRELVKA